MIACRTDNDVFSVWWGHLTLIVYGGYVGSSAEWADRLRVQTEKLERYITNHGIDEAFHLLTVEEIKQEQVKPVGFLADFWQRHFR